MDTFGMLLFMFGGLAFWVFLILFIVRKVKKIDTRKSGMISIICLCASFAGIIIGVASTPESSTSSKASAPTDKVPNINAVEPEILTDRKPFQEPDKNEEDLSQIKADITSGQTESASNGVDESEWPEVAALNMPNDTMLNLYKEYYSAIYGDDYPEGDDDEAIEAYEEKVGKEISSKYGITPQEAFFVYSYVSMNYGKVANGGVEVSKEPKISHGELQSVVTNGALAIVSAKIMPSLTNEMTIEQNYINVSDLITDQDYDVFDEIQYFAFADTIDGDQVKVISFTVPKRTIQLTKDGKIFGTMLADYVDDLWISPILEK